MATEETLLFENAEFMYRPNFSGRAGMYNDEGEREISIKVDETRVDELIAAGWNIKRGKDAEGNKGQGEAYLPVEVSFKFREPRIIQITSRGGTPLDQDLCGLLDAADIKFFDVIVRAYDWNVNNTSGRKAYLKTFVATIDEDYLEQKYADVIYGMNKDMEDYEDRG
jgi:hypothetical protein